MLMTTSKSPARPSTSTTRSALARGALVTSAVATPRSRAQPISACAPGGGTSPRAVASSRNASSLRSVRSRCSRSSECGKSARTTSRPARPRTLVANVSASSTRPCASSSDAYAARCRCSVVASVPSRSNKRPARAARHATSSPSLHHRARLARELVETCGRGHLPAHHLGDDVALRAPDAHGVAAIALPRHRAVRLQRDGAEVRVLVVERAEELRAGRALVGRQVAGGLDDDLLRLGAGDELGVFPGGLAPGLVLRRDDDRAAAGRY